MFGVLNHIRRNEQIPQDTMSLQLTWSDLRVAEIVSKNWQRFAWWAAHQQSAFQLLIFHDCIKKKMNNFSVQYAARDIIRRQHFVQNKSVETQRKNFILIVEKVSSLLTWCDKTNLKKLSEDLSARGLFEIAEIINDMNFFNDKTGINSMMNQQLMKERVYFIKGKSHNGDRIELRDGSVWAINPNDALKCKEWPIESQVCIKPNDAKPLTSDFTFIITNIFNGISVISNNLYGSYHHCVEKKISAIDCKKGVFELNDSSCWTISLEDCQKLSKWRTNDKVTMGSSGIVNHFICDNIAAKRYYLNEKISDPTCCLFHGIKTEIFEGDDKENYECFIEKITLQAFNCLENGTTFVFKTHFSGYEIELWDGSLWAISPKFYDLVAEWKCGDKIAISPSLNPYKFILNNLSLNEAVLANVAMESKQENYLHRRIKSIIRPRSGEVYYTILLNDESVWYVSNFKDEILSWEKNDGVCFGWRGENKIILINQKRCNYMICYKKIMVKT